MLKSRKRGVRRESWNRVPGRGKNECASNEWKCSNTLKANLSWEELVIQHVTDVNIRDVNASYELSYHTYNYIKTWWNNGADFTWSQGSISGVNTCFILLDHEHRVEHFCNRSWNISAFQGHRQRKFTYKLQVWFQRLLGVEMSKVFHNARVTVLPTDISIVSIRLPGLLWHNIYRNCVLYDMNRREMGERVSVFCLLMYYIPTTESFVTYKCIVYKVPCNL